MTAQLSSYNVAVSKPETAPLRNPEHGEQSAKSWSECEVAKRSTTPAPAGLLIPAALQDVVVMHLAETPKNMAMSHNKQPLRDSAVREGGKS